jgi:hypothetical protein
MIHYELAEIVRARVCDGLQARTADAVNMHLGEAVRAGIARASLK